MTEHWVQVSVFVAHAVIAVWKRHKETILHIISSSAEPSGGLSHATERYSEHVVVKIQTTYTFGVWWTETPVKDFQSAARRYCIASFRSAWLISFACTLAQWPPAWSLVNVVTTHLTRPFVPTLRWTTLNFQFKSRLRSTGTSKKLKSSNSKIPLDNARSKDGLDLLPPR